RCCQWCWSKWHFYLSRKLIRSSHEPRVSWYFSKRQSDSSHRDPVSVICARDHAEAIYCPAADSELNCFRRSRLDQPGEGAGGHEWRGALLSMVCQRRPPGGRCGKC